MTHPQSGRRVSIHGGHSGEFCTHARDTLEGILDAYQSQGFSWVGLTEHMPPSDDRFRYPDEAAAGLDAAALQERFGRYMRTARQLQHRFRNRLRIWVGFETEYYSGADDWIRALMRKYKPDYVVGSVHHVNDINFDFSAGAYRRAQHSAGGIGALYCRYFDRQFDLIDRIRPDVVGHFDLIRIFDRDYPHRMTVPAVWQRICRNLRRIRDLGLTLDLNMRALAKGAAEPYPTQAVLQQALELGIPVVPGDDSHGISTVGDHIDSGIALLRRMGFNSEWRPPIRRRPEQPRDASSPGRCPPKNGTGQDE